MLRLRHLYSLCDKELTICIQDLKDANKLEVKYLKSDFESLVSHRATKVLELKRLVLRILAARSEILAHMNNESSQAEAGVKVKAKDAKEEAEIKG